MGESSDSTALTLTKSDSVSSGNTYVFRYRVKNVHGWSGYSPTVSVVAAEIPATPSAATTAIAGVDSITVSWSAPSANGQAITAYKIEIENSSGVWAEESTYCDGTDAGIISATSCSFTITYAMSQYGLAVADLVVARVSALNAVGWSGTSTPNSSGANIETVSNAPVLTLGSATDST